MAQSLLEACGLLDHVRVVEPVPATAQECAYLHDEEYLACLRGWRASPTSVLRDFNLVEDASPFAGVDEHAAWIAGASLTAAQLLLDGSASVAVNLCGGRHHASASRASGFCYVNDVVLSALRLSKALGRVLCVDIDVHHGDGTESSFLHSPSVCTCSFHQFEPGFFPGSGGADVRGEGRGVGFNVNVPLPRGTTGAAFVERFRSVLGQLAASFRPSAVVLVCGADALRSDPRGGLQLDASHVCACAEFLREATAPAPLLLLGGGGYDFAATAKCWTRVVAGLCQPPAPVCSDVPEHLFFDRYGPSWRMLELDVDVDVDVDEDVDVDLDLDLNLLSQP